MRQAVAQLFIVTLSFALWPAPATGQQPWLPIAHADRVGTACGFRLGFRALHDAIPELVGDCLEDEQHNPENGDGLQRTTRGLLVWRKADNWTAFTDGATTWINGPEGLASRPNADRFPWEATVAESGIEGVVVMSPTCPGPVREGTVCERPYRATISVRDNTGRQVTRFESDDQGRFRVPLPPGRYVLHPESSGRFPIARDQTVTVQSGQLTNVRIVFDTGIR
jgi:hypothetical protein